MSWTVFINKCNQKLGTGTKDRKEFVDTIVNEYDSSIKRHIDVISGGNTYTTNAQIINKLLDTWTYLNTLSPPTVVANVNILDQFKFIIPLYWTGATIVGPLGITQVLFPGVWLPVELKPNLDFKIMLGKISLLAALHIKTMFGTFTSSTTGLIIPWSGASLMST